MKNQEGKRISNTRMTIYAPQTGNKKSTQSKVYSPSSTRKYWRSESTTSPIRMLKNYTDNITSDSDTRVPISFKRTQQEEDKKMLETLPKLYHNNKNYTSSMNIESDSDPEIQIISEQMTKVNNEPTHKKIRLSVDKSTDPEKKEYCPTNIWNEENVQTENKENRASYEETVSNIPLSNFDEKAASETLLLLSSSS